MKRFEVGLSNGSVLTLERTDGKQATLDGFMNAICDAINNDFIYLNYGDEALIKVADITYVLYIANKFMENYRKIDMEGISDED